MILLFIYCLLNFSSLISQEENLNPKGPGPLFAFGQNILKKHECFGLTSFGTYINTNRTIAIQYIELLYGITNNFSFFVEAPIIIHDKSNNFLSQGLGNLILQAEYAVYKKVKPFFLNQTTIIGSFLLPSTTTKEPLIIATKSLSLFFGATHRFILEPWIFYGECGAIITTRKKDTKLGNTLFFDCGIGRGLHDQENSYLGILLEGNGIYYGKSCIHGIRNKKSFVFFLGPTARWQSKTIVVQAGIQYPCFQQGFPSNGKNEYRAILSCALKF